MSRTQVPSSHQAIITQTTVKVTVGNLVFDLTPALINSNIQTIYAIDIFDVVKKAQWANQDFPVTQWSWQYKGQTALYMQIWGPRNNEYLVEFSRCAISGISINCKGQTINFEAAINPQSEGFAFIWIKL